MENIKMLNALQYVQTIHSTMMAPNYIFSLQNSKLSFPLITTLSLNLLQVSEVDSALHDCTEFSIIDPSMISATVSSKPTAVVSMEKSFPLANHNP